MNADEILSLLVSDPRVYLHYTDEGGLESIQSQGVIRTNDKFAVYFTQEPFSEAEAHTRLFIGATTHAGRGSHILVVRLDNGLALERSGFYEVCARQSVRLSQHQVLYAGPNPF
ncbi:MAG: hypothetical protein HUU21_20105 [Polyangiaceae bacterium]|nr:hypothetical protein [Polyangiaceae bacterium]